MKLAQGILTVALLTASSFVSAEEDYITVSAFLGTRINQDINNQGSTNNAELSSELTESLSIGWKYDTKAEGELLFSNSKQHFSMTGSELDTYVQYLHVGGKVLFTNDTPFSTNIGIGAGITYFNPSTSEYDAKTALSAHLSGGLRYQINQQFALRSDLRVYGTRFNTEKNLFCKNGSCLINLDDSFYLQTEILMGFEYKF